MNLKQQSFVTEMLRNGDKVMAYKNAYNSKSINYDALESAANRLLRNPEIRQAIEETRSSIRAAVEAELKEQLHRELLSVQRKREILARIAEGDVLVEQINKTKDCRTCSQWVKPTISHMLKAIDMDNKMTSEYTSRKQITVVHAVNTKPEILNTKEEKVETPVSNFKMEEDQTNVKSGEVVEIPVKVISPGTIEKQEKNTTLPIRENERTAVKRISHAGLRKLFETPVKKRKEAFTE